MKFVDDDDDDDDDDITTQKNMKSKAHDTTAQQKLEILSILSNTSLQVKWLQARVALLVSDFWSLHVLQDKILVVILALTLRSECLLASRLEFMAYLTFHLQRRCDTGLMRDAPQCLVLTRSITIFSNWRPSMSSHNEKIYRLTDSNPRVFTIQLSHSLDLSVRQKLVYTLLLQLN